MKTYTCICGQLIFFDNVACVHCRRELGFLPDRFLLTSLDPANDGLWRPTNDAGTALYRKCQNYSAANVCNWMVPQSEREEPFCASCRLNEIIPDLADPTHRDLWALVESAKRRLLYSLIQLKLPVAGKRDDPQQGLAFRFLSDVVNSDGTTAKVMTGHDHGIITLNIAEADDATRETVRHAMNEPYRTLLGHFRHEIGHYYWDRLVRDTPLLQPYRELFGDERADYAAALSHHYAAGAPANWQESYISAYATAHPWEDWAETWAHFLHIQDALEVASDFGLSRKRIPLSRRDADARTHFSWRQAAFDDVIASWSNLAVALNSINRSMGLPDLYPFVLSPAVIAKLRFVYETIVAAGAPAPQTLAPVLDPATP